ncbi:AlpA family transcriptional regulator [Escherichia albertii]|uniref:helix-turn-helix transcriptional regulator n=1 Tax=Enterobacterales TaxID=91347 RepID=UPI0015DD933E|nr:MULTISPECIES: AlpA family transcriptional regulator [Enterobacterales]MBA0216222.1 AlpA family transcriptional regulator [Pectobacterium brasiliense]MBN3073638.1 AlpA family transcriptional regulator [Pectobacterium brasiliense]MBN3171908.1 AlpA family transcriptional regulator [Pectobacterium brasiliense]MCQ8929749.1 AlpA family transcriptional regulator [Escherichia albertii]MCQ8964967.1 AlpA family transcriptional regulator [Escherichia albertii]
MKEKTKLIRISEVIDRTGFCRAWIYRLIKNNSFPSPVKTGERSIAFIESEVDQWIEEKIFYSRNQAA